MTNSNSNRDDELETIRQLLIATANRTESNAESIDRLTNKLDQSIDRLTNKLDQSIDHLTNRLDNLSVKVEQTTSNVDNLTATVNQLAADAVAARANADADRTAMFVILEQMATLQQENKQVLEYLFGQRRNGSGDQPQP